MAHQHVVGGEHVVQVVLARDRHALRLVARVAAQVEGQADAAQRRDLVRARQVLLLAAVPAVHQQHAGHHGRGRHQRAGDVLAVDGDLDGVIAVSASGWTTAYLMIGPTWASTPWK